MHCGWGFGVLVFGGLSLDGSIVWSMSIKHARNYRTTYICPHHGPLYHCFQCPSSSLRVPLCSTPLQTQSVAYRRPPLNPFTFDELVDRSGTATN
ncbi:hypothetical protein QBC39DRAFT_359979 [Podospora conica]|nr:hypothetical protein QBC39DRAFT_359979 [Schizothecium conicum]